MPTTYKPVVIIIDDFTNKSSVYSNTTLYDAGFLHLYRQHDFYTTAYGYYDGYGDVDYSEYVIKDTTLNFHQTPNASGYDIGLSFEGSYIDPLYGYDAYYNDYEEWVGHNTSANTTQHGDWVLEAFRQQADNPNDSQVILIDLDSNGGYIDNAQSINLFSLITSSYSGKTMTTLEGIIEEWLILNSTDSVTYLPVALSYSIAGPMATQNESYALDMLSSFYTTVVQAIPNVNSNGFVWGNTYSDVVNVGAYNVDANNYSLHGNPMDPTVIDILANGYVERSGWENGWNFGTSFATPRVTAEITNMWVEYLNTLNQQLASGEITQADIDNAEGVSYADYVTEILNTISTDVYIELAQGWVDAPLSVLADDVATSSGPIQVSQLNIGLSNYQIAGSSLTQPEFVVADASGKITGTSVVDTIQSDALANLIQTLGGNDVVTLMADGTWEAGYKAKNVAQGDEIGTNQSITLSGMNRFSDVIDAGTGTDTLNLTLGNDAFFLEDIYSAFHQEVVLTPSSQGESSAQRMVGLENIYAGAGDDIVDLSSINYLNNTMISVWGDVGDDVIWASSGDDVLYGGADNDILFGGSGSDTLSGGMGEDIFQFSASAGNDVINDFELSSDSIQLYYRAQDNHAKTDLSLANGLLTWDVDNTANDVVIDLSHTIASSNLNDVEALISFVEIV